MKITRDFGCGPYTFELTPEELLAAYKEQQHKYDVTVVEDKLSYYAKNPDEFAEAFNTSYCDMSREADTIAHVMRRKIDDYNGDPFYSLIEAIESVLLRMSE